MSVCYGVSALRRALINAIVSSLLRISRPWSADRQMHSDIVGARAQAPNGVIFLSIMVWHDAVVMA